MAAVEGRNSERDPIANCKWSVRRGSESGGTVDRENIPGAVGIGYQDERW